MFYSGGKRRFVEGGNIYFFCKIQIPAIGRYKVLLPTREEHVAEEPEDKDSVGDILHPVDLLREVNVGDPAQVLQE